MSEQRRYVGLYERVHGVRFWEVRANRICVYIFGSMVLGFILIVAA